jgi:uncharacterized membrane protein
MSQTKRSKINMNNSNMEKILYASSLIGLVLIWMNLIIEWNNIPHRIPVHFGALGKPDSWGGKSSLLIVPIIAIGVYLLLTLISRVPHCFNYAVEITEENAERQYRNAKDMMLWMIVEIVYFFLYLEWQFVQIALNKSKSLGVVPLPIFILVLFGTIIFYIRRMTKLK